VGGILAGEAAGSASFVVVGARRCPCARRKLLAVCGGGDADALVCGGAGCYLLVYTGAVPAMPACGDSSTPTATASVSGTAPNKQLTFTGLCAPSSGGSAYTVRIPLAIQRSCRRGFAQVLYSLDGSTPSTEWDGTTPISLSSGSVTVKARLALSGYAFGAELASVSVDNTPAGTPKLALSVGTVASIVGGKSLTASTTNTGTPSAWLWSAAVPGDACRLSYRRPAVADRGTRLCLCPLVASLAAARRHVDGDGGWQRGAGCLR
jgi:hypothetical protein